MNLNKGILVCIPSHLSPLYVRRYHFKANLLNPDVIHKGGLQGVPRKRTNPNLTHPVSPHLATKKLALTRKALHDEEEHTDGEADDRKFLAQPMPNFAEIKVRARKVGLCNSSWCVLVSKLCLSALGIAD